MKARLVLLALLVLASFPSQTALGDESQHMAPKTSERFQGLKKLVGLWEGKEEGKPAGEHVALEYRLTSGGSVLEERLFKGQPHEMISMYHDDGPSVVMTHYCMVGNQPRLRMTQADSSSWTFDFVDATNMSSPDEEHMHRLKLSMPDNDHLVQEWTSYKMGKPSHTAVFTFVRKTA